MHSGSNHACHGASFLPERTESSAVTTLVQMASELQMMECHKHVSLYGMVDNGFETFVC
jgi:hypothetical protein